MSSSDGRSGSGQRIKRVPANIWNGMVGAGQQFLNSELGGTPPPSNGGRRTDLIKVKNSTGTERKRGEVVTIAEMIVDDLGPDMFWFDGVEPQRGKHFAILKNYVQPNQIIDAQVIGLTLARVDITSNAHRFARLPDEGCVLESCSLGPLELLYSPELPIGEDSLVADCLVNIRSPTVGIFKTPVDGIPGRTGDVADSAECDTYWIDNDGEITLLVDDDDDPIKTKVFNIFTGAVGAEVYITAKDVHGIAVADAEDCS